MIPLRPYQADAFERARSLLRAAPRGPGLKRIVFVLATGGGKTVVASHFVSNAVAKSKTVLFVAHRKELIKQAWCKLVRNGVSPADVGVIMAGVHGTAHLPWDSAEALQDDDLWDRFGRRRPGAPVQVASVDTLRTKAVPPSDLVIIDECHRSLSAGYVRLLQALPDAVFVGLTATPERADRRGLNELVPLSPDGSQPPVPYYQDLVIGATYEQLTGDGFLVSPQVWTVPARELQALERVKLSGGDYDLKQLSTAMDTGALVGSIVEHWKRHAEGLPTLAFGVDRDHSRHIAAQFEQAGVRALHVDGESEASLRDQVRYRLSLPYEHSDRLDVVSNCDVFTEGFDCPAVKCVVLARPTKSLRIYLQQVGRGSRPDGKDTRFVVLDHAGCAVEHGLPQEDREWSLDGKKKSPKTKSAPVRVCEKCFAVMPAGTPFCTGQMPDGTVCGWQFPAPIRETPMETEGELVEVRGATKEEMFARWTEILAERDAKNSRRAQPIKPGWCYHRFKELYRRMPPRGFPKPEGGEEHAEQEPSGRAALLDRVVREAVGQGHSIGWARMKIGGMKGQRYPSNDEFAATSFAAVAPDSFAAWLAGEHPAAAPISEHPIALVSPTIAPIEAPQVSTPARAPRSAPPLPAPPVDVALEAWDL